VTPYVVAFTFVVSRALAFVSDARCPSWRLGITLAISIVVPSLAFQVDLRLVVALACIVPQVLLLFITERVETRIRWRLLLLPTIVAPFLLPPHLSPRISGPWITGWSWLRTAPIGSDLFAKIAPRFVLTHAAGLILCLCDGNLLLRSCLRWLKITPPTESTTPQSNDPSQYLRGGLVGAVERLLIYVFAANSAFNAIAFVITVKGVVRYQEIVKNHSAEYVLVGTLISTLIAMLLGILLVHAVP
jgi:hypothetical protein